MKLITALLAVIAAPALLRIVVIVVFLAFLFAGARGSGFDGWATSSVMLFIIGFIGLRWLRSGAQCDDRRDRR
jgi:hypothetical protein